MDPLIIAALLTTIGAIMVALIDGIFKHYTKI
jgi:hypothetical protein